jgi:hypothetical protein
VRFVLRRVPRSQVPPVTADDGAAFVTWLDDQWVALDTEVDRALEERRAKEERSNG